ncbi:MULTISPECIES: Rieske (2Fe-2S) protein [unclassified Paenibacillus]|uniref:Rieske (2Fe-2S) protein n=1 Tax=unclassified Paenibacillus TaxID=185978 RepID=UPI001AE4F392|nr:MULTISPECIES: Rieske (2Fe-2S) protein [unclassified Paenibacillus]MBP1156227.1 3-phenylpropionate/trans-cinnamate dioxygenase ferredoxin subunit [Paenibacillus sp. PvP091]MBP1168387.1 3-phenylpropionate/trans-cinnamate dioxygenase ferredoxin subunit [Paenibacillus sp. PvR098]MBP2439415.1 3-phenylpropionate/trans-cinnamate dioxygenase ferredoxin subunit [Paenibacillus sp. PvP052]
MSGFLVGKASEIPEGDKKIVVADGRSIGVYNIGGQFYAIRNTCPHQGAALCTGITAAFITSSGTGSFEYERDGEIVRCPWHQWEFDIKTGCMVIDPKMRTKSYEVTVERYDVSIEDQDVYIHL